MKLIKAGATGFTELGYLRLTNSKRLFLDTYYKKSDVLKMIKKDLNISLFLDSGAFSAFTKGISIDIDEYIQFI